MSPRVRLPNQPRRADAARAALDALWITNATLLVGDGTRHPRGGAIRRESSSRPHSPRCARRFWISSPRAPAGAADQAWGVEDVRLFESSPAGLRTKRRITGADFVRVSASTDIRVRTLRGSPELPGWVAKRAPLAFALLLDEAFDQLLAPALLVGRVAR